MSVPPWSRASRNSSVRSMKMAKHKVGVIGIGYWGKKILDEFTMIENVEVLGVSDLADENLAFARDRYGVDAGYKDYRELLAVDGVEAVAICVPNKDHFRICKDALEAGKHVLIEKPITTTSKEGDELVELAQAKGLTLSVGHIFRFNNALAEVRRLISEEKFFGKLFLMEMTWVNLEKAFPDRDVLFDLAPHMFDIQNYLLGKWPDEIICTGGSSRIPAVRNRLERVFGMPVIEHQTFTGVAAGLAIVQYRAGSPNTGV